MSVSGSTSFTLNLKQAILMAFQKIGLYGVGRNISPEDYTVALNNLNIMLKAWGTKGLHIWTKTEAVIYLTPNKSKYYFGNYSSVKNATLAYATTAGNEVMTQTTASASLGAISLSVINTIGMSVGDYIGVVQSDLTIWWTTIAAIPNSTSLTLTAGTTNTINNSANVYTYTTPITNKPYRILSARLVWGFDSGSTSTINELIMNPMSHADYYDLPNKTVNGSTSNQFYYDAQLDYGVLNLWARPNDGSYRVRFTYERIIDDMINITDNFDIPAEWMEPIVWQLALRLCPDFGKEQKLKIIQPIAEQMLNNLLDFDNEQTSISFQPDHDGGGVY